jgi:hypothetical protein
VTLLRWQTSLHYACSSCGGDFRIAVIVGPRRRQHLTIALFCPLCGKDRVWLVPQVAPVKA